MDKRKAEDVAAQRVQLLSPLLAEGLDSAKRSQIKTALCEQHGISERTLRRYLARYREGGFSGLKPHVNLHNKSAKDLQNTPAKMQGISKGFAK